MDYAATQIYEEEDFECTQRISQTFEEKELTQVGILNIDSTEYQIKNGTTKIGRLSTCDICINDMTVSKIHAEIEANTGQGSTWISDLLSANKTKLNNSILRPKRWYELKDGSVIEFGKVRAVYRIYGATNDIVIPETPAPTQQKVAGTVIPNTPDSSINNSSADDGSVILGTQTEEEKKNVFRRPLLPQQRQSTSIDKKNTSRGVSTSENDDSQIDIRLHISVNDSSESEGVSIFDMETQKYEESRKTVASVSIHDMETQNILTKMPKNTEANATVKKQSALNPRDKMVESSASINDMETQNCINGNEQQSGTAVGTSNADIPNETTKKSTTNDLKTQNYIVGAAESNIDIQGAAARKSMTDIHDLETQNYLADSTKNIRDTTAKRSTTNIHDLETQNYIIGAAKSNIGAHRSENDKSKTRTADVDEHDIHNLETQKIDNNNIVEDICDMETQLALGGTTSESSSSRADKNSQDKSKDQRNAAQVEANRENAATLPSSRSNSPEMILSLNLSSQDINEDHPSSPLNESAHLLESSDLLEYFAEGIDKPRECNTSTPKPSSKTSLQKDKAENAMENDQKDDIYNLPTQHINGKLSDNSEANEEEATVKRKLLKKKHEKPRPTRIDDDSETDAEDYLEELAKKQGAPLETTSKSRDTNVGNNNDSETSANSDDMFDMLTQKLDSHSAKNTSNSPIKQQPKINQTVTVVDDMMPTQKMNVKDKRDRYDRPDTSSTDIDDTALTQLLSSRQAPPKTAISSKNSLPVNNPNDVDDTAPTQIMHANSSILETNNRCAPTHLDCEDLDYETAPTQVIGEVVQKINTTRRTSYHTKATKSSKVDLNDTLERNLKEMFDDANSDNVHEHALMSTQCLEDILQSSQCDDLFPNNSTVEEKAPQTKSRKKSNQLPLNAKNSEVNKNTVSDIDSQNSDSYFATITTRRKRNVIKDTQDFVVSTENVPQKSKGETKDDNPGAKSNKKGKRIAKSKSKTGATTVDLIDNTSSKIISSESNKRIVGKTKSVKQKHRTASKANEQILKADSRKVEVDHSKGNLVTSSNDLDTYAPCSSEGGQNAQGLSTLLESDDDILTRLPAVRISGTLSNPPSPSASSTSTVLSVRSKRGGGKDQKKDEPSKSKSLTRNSSRVGNKPQLRDNDSSSLENLEIDATSEVNDSVKSDSSTSYRRFKQMADRILNKEGNYLKKPNKNNKSARGADKSMSGESNSACSSLDVPKDPKQRYDLGGSRNPTRSSLRVTRSSNRQNNESSCVQLTEEAHAEGTIDKFTKPKTKSTAGSNRKRGLNTAEEITEEQISSKKHKVDGVIGEEPREAGTSDTKAENAAKFAVTRSRRRMTDKSETTRAKEKDTSPVLLGIERTLKVVLNPIVDDASQEVEMIIMRNVSDDVQNENLSIREGSNARIFQKEFSSRSTRSRKRAKTNATIDSSSIESNLSSETSDLESVQSGNAIAPTRAKRARSTKNSVPPPQETPAPKNEVFKRPTRVNRSSANLTDNVTENPMSDDSRNSIQTDSSLNIRLSRSKTAGNKNMWKVEMNENSRKNRTANISVSPEINTSVGSSSFCVSTPTRTRRSASSLSISSPFTTRHRILFTGMKEDKYDNIIRTLGGSRVETPNLCTVLVTDKVRRTYKFLCALAKGVPIVSVNWLSDSESARQFLDWESYILKDLVAEAKFGFRLRKSLDKAKEKRLLLGYTVVLTPNIGQPPTKELKDIITSCGGKALLSPPAVWPEKAMIISHQVDLPNVKKYLAKAPKTVTVQSTEFILIGILRQEVDFNKHRLI